jgi:serine/threonine protein kinase/tetratricopeptide (TPR) repeat protein
VDEIAGLARTGSASGLRLLTLLRADQAQRWQAGQRVGVEEYLRAVPALGNDPEAVLDLIYSEVLLREDRGEAPPLDEYRARFPQHHAALGQLWEVHQGLKTTAASGPGRPGLLAPDGSTEKQTAGTWAVEATQVPGPTPVPPTGPAPGGVPGYEIDRELGRGGMGIVFLARQTGLGRTVALKLIRGPDASPEERSRFRTEAESAARLSHPHIVSIIEVGEHNGRCYFSMEYCAGGSLEQRLKDNPLPPRAAAALVEKLSRAIQTAHQAQIIHRDLKPANVLLQMQNAECRMQHPMQNAECRMQNERPDSDSAFCILHSAFCIPKVTDFGLAKQLDATGWTQSGALLGTPSYMAPEQARGEGKDVGPAVDVYGLGAVLYECLTARPPFKAATPLETMAQVCEQEPVPPRALQPGVPRDLETIALKCLEKQPGKRYASAADLGADLGRFLAGEPIAARPAGRWERFRKWVKRRPAAAAAVAVGVLALVALTGGLTVAYLMVRDERDLAQAERQKALDAKTRTRAALDEVSSEAITTLLTQQQQLTDKHKAFLRRALELYSDFTKDSDASPQTQAEVARAHMRMGAIRTTLGELTEAKLALKRAGAMLTRLTAQSPDDPTLQADLAKTNDDLGLLAYRMGNRAEAESRFRRASQQFEALSSAHPENAKYRINQANTRINWANLLADRRRRPAAEAEYRKAIRTLESLPPAEAGQAELRGRLGLAHYNLAYLLEEMGKKKEAEAEYHRAIAIQEKVVKELPAGRDEARRLSSSLINLSELVAERGALDEGEKLLRRGLAIQETLARDYPSIPEYRKYLGRTLRALADRLGDRKKLAEARATYRRAIDVQQLLVKQYPKFPEYRRDLASTYNNFANFEQDQGRTPEAEAGFREAIRVQEPLVREHPTIPEFRRELANSYDNLGYAVVQRRAYSEAERVYRRALAQEEALLRQFPNAAEYVLRKGGTQGSVALTLAEQGKKKEALGWYTRSLDNLNAARARMKSQLPQGLDWLRNSYSGRATTLESLGRFTDALPDREQVIRLTPPAQRKAEQLRWALCLARAGQVEKATAQAGALTASEETSGELLVAAARVYGRAAEVSQAPRKHEYSAAALRLLRWAEGRGHFTSAAALARLTKDRDLAGLRALAEFRDWLAKVRQRKK